MQHTIRKTWLPDPNGEVSVSYLDPYGRVIATALAGANQVDS